MRGTKPSTVSFRDEQLMTFVVSKDRKRGWIADLFGIGAELSPLGRRSIRLLWENEPERREAFGGEEPPAEWNSTTEASP